MQRPHTRVPSLMNNDINNHNFYSFFNPVEARIKDQSIPVNIFSHIKNRAKVRNFKF